MKVSKAAYSILRRPRYFGRLSSPIDAHEYTPEAKQEDWAYLGTGIVARTDADAFVRFADPLAPGLL